MRSQSAIFVDAGYLIAAAATRLTGSSLRRGVNVDYEKLVVDLIALAEERSSLPLLRVYWYDAGKSGAADPDHEKIAALPKVKLRLGRIGVEGEQKGVDLRIGLDMVAHSRTGAVDTIYLLSGDDDLTEAVEEAQTQGVQVVILAVPGSSGSPHGVSRHLVKAADGVEVLAQSILDASVATAITAPPMQVVRNSGGHSGVPSPLDLARHNPPAPTQGVAYSSGGFGSRRYIAPEYQYDPAELTKAINEVIGKAYGAWSKTATTSQRNELLAGRPTIPRDLDRALLVDLSDALGDHDLSDDVRVQLRARFWDAATQN